jgi:thermostable 8-oxoguanine DNA glycosylase
MSKFLVDPTDVTKFDRTDGELQLFFLFCQTVAGKTAKVQAKFLDAFLQRGNGDTPFEIIQDMVNRGVLLEELKSSSLGQYNRLAAGFEASLTLDLRNATLDQIMDIKGVGNKTARFFLLHSRPDQNIAVLDVHILKYLRSQGFEAPKQTPSGKKYLELEKNFLELAKKNNMTPADFDLMLWTKYSTKEVEEV